ncbi:MAG: hypothetical protein AAFR52_14775 [Pseudomonadota bacterium]
MIHRNVKRAAFVAAGLAALALGLMAADTPDPRIAENPDLLALFERDPEAAGEVMERIDELLEAPRQDRPRNLDTDDEVRALIGRNPIIQEVYRRDPKATAKLIGVIRPGSRE